MKNITSMKCNFLILTAIAFVLGIAFSGCKKETPETVTPEITNDKVETIATTATFTWTVDWHGKLISVVEVSENENMSNSLFYGSEEETENHTFTVTVPDLKEATKYYYRYLVWNRNFVGNKFVMETKRVITGNCAYNGHEYIDLGLPSGTLWATCNVGASSPEDYGDYFAWGETTTKSIYYWENYKYCNGDNRKLTKYCSSPNSGNNGFTDTLTVLQAIDDAATANWGGGWCMPTKAQWEELKDNTSVTWTTQNGVDGVMFCASNGRSLFLPSAGHRIGKDLLYTGRFGNYWSSTLRIDHTDNSWYLEGTTVSNHLRNYGQSVRPVLSGTYINKMEHTTE